MQPSHLIMIVKQATFSSFFSVSKTLKIPKPSEQIGKTYSLHKVFSVLCKNFRVQLRLSGKKSQLHRYRFSENFLCKNPYEVQDYSEPIKNTLTFTKWDILADCESRLISVKLCVFHGYQKVSKWTKVDKKHYTY